MDRIYHKTKLGSFYHGDSVQLIKSVLAKKLAGKVQLILTSPPFPLNTKKRYGNKEGEQYKEWFANLAKPFSDLLTKDGSIVIEIGNSWLPKRPVQSLLHIEALLNFLKNRDANLRLCQEFVCYNPSRLPSPAQWVTIERIRATDSYTHLWWMAKTDYPKADNKKVLKPYSKSMEQLLKKKSYNFGKRPSGHYISKKGFLKDQGGSIPPNFFELEKIQNSREVRLPNAFSFSNTVSNDYFLKVCRENNLRPHPARMPLGLTNFFIQFLTDPGDLVMDPFAGSNVTGFCAEMQKRRWVAIEKEKEYAEQSKLRLGLIK